MGRTQRPGTAGVALGASGRRATGRRSASSGLRINAGPDRDAAKIIRPGCAGNEKSSSRTATGKPRTRRRSGGRNAEAERDRTRVSGGPRSGPRAAQPGRNPRTRHAHPRLYKPTTVQSTRLVSISESLTMYVTPTAGPVALHTETARYTDGRTTWPRSARKPSDNAYRHSQPHKSHNSGGRAPHQLDAPLAPLSLQLRPGRRSLVHGTFMELSWNSLNRS